MRKTLKITNNLHHQMGASLTHPKSLKPENIVSELPDLNSDLGVFILQTLALLGC